MDLIKKDYISIDFIYKWLTEELFNRRITHENMKIFYEIIADWRRQNENSDGSSV